MKTEILFLSIVALLAGCNSNTPKEVKSANENGSHDKVVIYQMMTRLFGNQNTTNKYYGSIQENGCGKFNDITGIALDSLKTLGITHIWYTGIIEHATMNDYSALGIKPDDPDIVKGRAGSPYAIKDYYDVDPDLAVDVKSRMEEFEALVNRTHEHGLKVLIDFVPNHVARTYQSDAKPADVKDFGETDDKTKAFSATNDFYYIPGKSFVVPVGVNAGGNEFVSALKDGKFDETPAKATGNNVFNNAPKIDDWYETVKLNYGVDYKNSEQQYFEPTPPVWLKMRDILLFWAKKNVDGFRCDVAEMVPVAFWSWVIPQVKKVNPAIIFIAEAYNPKEYVQYLNKGQFDYLYDKVGLYDTLKRLIKGEPNANVWGITAAHDSVKGYNDRMLSFLENHDEERIASKGFAQNPMYALPAMTVAATISCGPVMIYFGQEVGEKGAGKEGFGGEDNRTTVFDYWGVPAHQQWMNGGKFDGGLLSNEQKQLRSFYQKLFTFCNTNDAVQHGNCVDMRLKNADGKVYAFLRYTKKCLVLVVANFSRTNDFDGKILISPDLMNLMSFTDKDIEKATELFSCASQKVSEDLVHAQVPAMGVGVYEISLIQK